MPWRSAMAAVAMIYVLRRRGSLRFLLRPRAKKAVRNSIRTGFASSVNSLYQFILILVINRLLMERVGLALPAALLLLPPPLEQFWWFYLIAEGGTFLFLLGFTLRKNSRRELESDFDGQVYTAVICNSEELCSAVECIGDSLSEHGSTPASAISASLVLEELCGVILEQSKMENIYIQITLVCEQENLTLHIRGNALRFNPFDMSRDMGDLLAVKNDALIALGMKIVNKKTKGFFYRRYAGFNTLVIKL